MSYHTRMSSVKKGSLGRPRDMDDELEQRFRAAWLDVSRSIRVIALEMERNQSTLYWWALCLDLPRRTTLRTLAGIPTHGTAPVPIDKILAAHRRRGEQDAENWAAQMIRCEAMEAQIRARQKQPVDRATCYVCGAVCPLDKLGHDSCTGRRAA